MFFQKEKRKSVNKYSKFIVCITLVLVIVFVYTVRLLQLQVVDYDYYLKESKMSSASTITVDATRGEILDRYGRTIAYNREGYNVVIDYSTSSNSNINMSILKAVKILKKNKDEWRDKLPISNKQPYKFTDSNNSTDVKNLKSKLELNNYATLQNCVDVMIEKFGLESYSSKTQRLLMGIRYTMLLEDFSTAYPFTLAEDVSAQTRSILLESSDSFQNISVKEVSVREYADDNLATHLIGTVGPIYAEDWETLKAKGYSYSDYVGKSGVELAFEDYLRGKNGVNKAITNPDTGETEIVTESEPVAGNTVLLTIDIDLQKKAQKSLATFMNKLAKEKIYAKSASIVCLNVNNGEILASANYPSYTMTDYNENYSKLAADETNPLFNRAFQGTYPPGSTFKPVVASIGLTVGSISKGTTVYCKKYYDYYKDMTFKCMHYHGNINVVDAIGQSCNYFFFDTGRKTGISIMNEYSKLMGYGVKTGVEVPESSGTLAGPSYTEKLGATWHPGDTLQAAIGQSYNLFTPLQIATGTATIANGGTRYRSHLLREVRTNDLSQVVVSPSAEVVANTGISKEAIKVVKSGMKKAAFEGTASSVFGSYKLEVGGKTGTAENPKPKRDNGLFISFAPYENSEIAVAINVEEGLYGYKTASVVKDIYDQYYFADYKANETPKYNELIY